jgi:hypothetical protein
VLSLRSDTIWSNFPPLACQQKPAETGQLENPADMTPICHFKLTLKARGERGSTLVDFPIMDRMLSKLQKIRKEMKEKQKQDK